MTTEARWLHTEGEHSPIIVNGDRHELRVMTPTEGWVLAYCVNGDWWDLLQQDLGRSEFARVMKEFGIHQERRRA